MVDFHSHVLPGMDDGARDLETSLEMLSVSASQGVDIVCATPHFYPDRESPLDFLSRRAAAYEELLNSGTELPAEVRLGAEVYYYPGMSGSHELKKLCIEGTKLLIVEPPMSPWNDAMLSEIEQTGGNLGLIPVLAHVDRYMRMLEDYELMDSLAGRRFLIQFNTDAFLDRDFWTLALDFLGDGRIQFLGSDMHGLSSRPQTFAAAADVIRDSGLSSVLSSLTEKAYSIFGK